MLVNLRRNSTSAGKKTTIYNTSAYSRFQQSHPDRQIRRIIKRIDMRTKRKEKKNVQKSPVRPREISLILRPSYDRFLSLAPARNVSQLQKKISLRCKNSFCLHQIKILYSAKKNSTFCLRTIRYTFRPLWYLVLRLATHPATHTWDRSQEIISNVACNRTPLLSRQV